MTKRAKQKPANTFKDYRYLDRAMLLRRRDATHYLWGDAESGQVNDIIYGLNERIGCVIFTLPPGGYYKMSKTWRPFNDQHRFYYVLQGQLTIHDPQGGGIAVAEPGEAIHWQGPRWHFAQNFSDQETAVLDWYAPHNRPLSQVLEEEGKGKPLLQTVRNGKYELLGKWPARLAEERAETLRTGGPVTISRREALNLLHGTERVILESIYASTSELTAGTVKLLPGVKSEPQSHPGDKIIFALRGNVHIYLPEVFEWYDLAAWDAMYIPKNCSHLYWNYGSEVVELAFLVIPKYK